jgi:hypothetical protein
MLHRENVNLREWDKGLTCARWPIASPPSYIPVCRGCGKIVWPTPAAFHKFTAASLSPTASSIQKHSKILSGLSIGAGEGNRTLVFSLEGCCSTIELHPRSYLVAGPAHAWLSARCRTYKASPRSVKAASRACFRGLPDSRPSFLHSAGRLVGRDLFAFGVFFASCGAWLIANPLKETFNGAHFLMVQRRRDVDVDVARRPLPIYCPTLVILGISVTSIFDPRMFRSLIVGDCNDALR